MIMPHNHTEYMRKWRSTNPERSREIRNKSRNINIDRVREADRKRQKTPHRRKTKNESKAKWRKTNPELNALARRIEKLKKYGLTPTTYETIVAAQENRCAICKTATPAKGKKYWFVDHCHETNAVRGLLCMKCNSGIAFLRHDAITLQSAIDYLNRGRHQ
jgi:hypothetical protein